MLLKRVLSGGLRYYGDVQAMPTILESHMNDMLIQASTVSSLVAYTFVSCASQVLTTLLWQKLILYRVAIPVYNLQALPTGDVITMTA